MNVRILKNFRTFSAVSITSATLLSGCMVGPNYKTPEAESKVPDKFGGVHAASTTQPVVMVDLTRWWTTFSDPTLNSLVDRAVASNLNLQLAEARLRQSRGQLGVSRADIFPEVNTNGSYKRYKSSQNTIAGRTTGGTVGTTTGGTTGSTGGSTGSSTTTTGGATNSTIDRDLYQAGFDASWEIDIFGGQRRGIEAAKADLQAIEEDRRATLVTLLGDVATNYISLRGAQRQLTFACNNLKAQQDTLELTRSRFKAGLTSDFDVARAQSQVATTAATIPTLEITIRQAIHALSILLGQEPTALVAELEKETPLPPAPPEIPVGLPSDLLRRRPDIRRAERQLAASTARVGEAVADLFPKFNLVGSFGWQAQRITQLPRSSSMFWSIGPSVSWPIFDANRIWSNVEVTKGVQEQSLITYRQTVLTSLSDVENALVAYSQEQNRRSALSDAVAANQRSVDLALQLYTKGLGDFLSVLTAQLNLFSSQDLLAQSDTAVSRNLIQLYKALGGGWNPDEKRDDGVPPNPVDSQQNKDKPKDNVAMK